MAKIKRVTPKIRNYFYVELAEHHYSTATGNLAYQTSFQLQSVNLSAKPV